MYKWLVAIGFSVLLLVPLGSQEIFAGNGGCTANNQCGQDEFCKKDTGSLPDDEGFCTIKPTLCPDVFAPVCGIDGMTYGNECEAHAQGVNVAHVGACRDTVGGELLPIDSTALLLVGIQMTASWLIPVLFVAAGFGIVIGMKFGHSGVVNDGRKNKPRFSSPPSNLLLIKKGVECTRCGRSFSSRRKLYEHKRKVHSY